MDVGPGFLGHLFCFCPPLFLLELEDEAALGSS